MTLPPFVYVKAFWQSLAWLVGGALTLLYFFGVIPVAWALAPDAVLALFLGILKLFDIVPEIKARAAKLAKARK